MRKSSSISQLFCCSGSMNLQHYRKKNDSWAKSLRRSKQHTDKARKNEKLVQKLKNLQAEAVKSISEGENRIFYKFVQGMIKYALVYGPQNRDFRANI